MSESEKEINAETAEFKVSPERMESPTISLAPDSKKRGVLEAALEKYRTRWDQEGPSPDTACKVAVTQRLLTTGFVDKAELFRQLTEKFDGITTFTFRNACGTIEALIEEVM